MALTLFSLLLLRRLSFSSKNPRPLFLSAHFSTSSLPASNPSTTTLDPQAKPSSLSARMSFIFEQIDEMEKQKQEKDHTLRRIRAWRQSKQQQSVPNSVQSEEYQRIDGGAERREAEVVSKTEENPVVVSSVEENPERDLDRRKGAVRRTDVEVAHPWPEWLELMERLVKQNYFDHRRKDEDKMVRDLGFDSEIVVEEDGGVGDVGVDFNDFKIVQTACLNFGKDRFDILRSLSRQDIQFLVGYGCPSTDKKVVFSAKLLRKHVHLDEGDVCSSCTLRSSCERAYLITNKEDEARTIDIMRVLLTYGFDPLNGSVVNKSLLKQKSVKTVVRKLLHGVVRLSAVPIDPNLPPPIIKKPPPKVKQPPPPPKKRVGRDDVEMKKGDWLCPKCDFMNFAKNTVCLQCDAKRPKRQLLPGEWECPECNFLNYRRNMACFHCDCKRPPDEFTENNMEERRQGPNMRIEKIVKQPEFSNAWNFNFDDDESDGVDVAAFEYADSSLRGEDSLLDSQAHTETFRENQYDFNKSNTVRRPHERGHSDPGYKPGMGFDDFDDEDDIDSYEIDTPNNYSARKASSNDFSEAEDIEGSDNNFRGHWRATPQSSNKPSKQMRQRAAFSGSEDDELNFDADEELPVHPKWKSSHVADSRHRGRGRGPSRGLSFGSDEEFGSHSDSDEDFKTRLTKGNKSFSNSESINDDPDVRRNRFGRNKTNSGRSGNNFRGRESDCYANDTRFRSNGRSNGKMDKRRSSMDNRRNSMDNRSSRVFHGDNRGSRKDDYGGRRMNDKRGDSRSFSGRKGFGNSKHGRSYKHDRDAHGDPIEFRNSRRVIER